MPHMVILAIQVDGHESTLPRIMAMGNAVWCPVACAQSRPLGFFNITSGSLCFDLSSFFTLPSFPYASAAARKRSDSASSRYPCRCRPRLLSLCLSLSCLCRPPSGPCSDPARCRYRLSSSCPPSRCLQAPAVCGIYNTLYCSSCPCLHCPRRLPPSGCGGLVLVRHGGAEWQTGQRRKARFEEWSESRWRMLELLYRSLQRWLWCVADLPWRGLLRIAGLSIA